MRTTTKTVSRITALVLAFSAIICLCACSTLPGQKQAPVTSKKDISDYIEELTEVDIGDYFAEAEMELERSASKETANIRIRLNENTVEKVYEILGMRIEKEPEPMAPIPGYQDHPYAVEMKKMNVTAHYKRVVSGKNVKSRPINFYIAEKDGEYFVFVFS